MSMLVSSIFFFAFLLSNPLLRSSDIFSFSFANKLMARPYYFMSFVVKMILLGLALALSLSVELKPKHNTLFTLVLILLCT